MNVRPFIGPPPDRSNNLLTVVREISRGDPRLKRWAVVNWDVVSAGGNPWVSLCVANGKTGCDLVAKAAARHVSVPERYPLMIDIIERLGVAVDSMIDEVCPRSLPAFRIRTRGRGLRPVDRGAP